jgi:hypothetical protein
MMTISIILATIITHAAIKTTQDVTHDAAHDVSGVPAGWKETKAKNGIYLFTPDNLKEGQVFEIAIYPSASLNGSNPKAFLEKLSDPLPLGKITKLGKVNDNNPNSVILIHEFLSAQGKTNSAVYFVFPSATEKQKITLVRIIDNDFETLKQYQDTAMVIVSAKINKKDNPVEVKKIIFSSFKEIKPGGKLVYGIYKGEGKCISNNNDHSKDYIDHLRLYLYPDNTYELGYEKDERSNIGLDFTYDPKTGQLNLAADHFVIKNDPDPHEAFSYFGYDVSNKPIIFARQNKGFSDYTVTLQYIAPPDYHFSLKAKRLKEEKIIEEKLRKKKKIGVK